MVRKTSYHGPETYRAILKESTMTEGGPPSIDGTEINGSVVLGPGPAKGDSPNSLHSFEMSGYDTYTVSYGNLL
jgi:hypothetical protein